MKCRSEFMPVIFDYIDYRKFLFDWCEAKAASDKGFSYRKLARKLDCDPGFLTRVIQGRRNISTALMLRLAGEFSLGKRERAYFDLLVRLNKARDPQEKRYLLEEISRIRLSRVKNIDPGQFEYFDKWYYPVIREMLDFYQFKGDYAELAMKVAPSIKPGEAKKAVQTLEKLGLIRKNEKDVYEKTDGVIGTGEGWRSMAIAAYQRNTLDLAGQAFDLYPEEARNFSNQILSISEETYGKIVETIKEFRAGNLALAQADGKADRVYQLNVQLFPVTKNGDMNK